MPRLTKKQIAEEAARMEAEAVRAALRWTDGDVSPDVPKPTEFGKCAAGWISIGASSNSARVEPAWSESVFHAIGSHVKRGYASQGGIALHSTKVRALRALRRETEKDAAERLRRIDLMIEAREGAFAEAADICASHASVEGIAQRCRNEIRALASTPGRVPSVADAEICETCCNRGVHAPGCENGARPLRRAVTAVTVVDGVRAGIEAALEIVTDRNIETGDEARLIRELDADAIAARIARGK